MPNAISIWAYWLIICLSYTVSILVGVSVVTNYHLTIASVD